MKRNVFIGGHEQPSSPPPVNSTPACAFSPFFSPFPFVFSFNQQRRCSPKIIYSPPNLEGSCDEREQGSKKRSAGRCRLDGSRKFFQVPFAETLKSSRQIPCCEARNRFMPVGVVGGSVECEMSCVPGRRFDKDN